MTLVGTEPQPIFAETESLHVVGFDDSEELGFDEVSTVFDRQPSIHRRVIQPCDSRVRPMEAGLCRKACERNLESMVSSGAVIFDYRTFEYAS